MGKTLAQMQSIEGNVQVKTGMDGVGIASVEQKVASNESNGENIVAITLTDGSVHEITIRNGQRGGVGEPGPQGEPGPIWDAPVGYVIITSKNENPAATLGGTWKLVGKKFKRGTYTNTEVDGLLTLGAHINEASVKFLLDDNEIKVYGTFQFKDSWSNLDYIVFRTNLEKLGCSRISFQTYVFAAANNAEGIGWGSFDTDGTFTAFKMYPETDGGSLPAGRTLAFSTSLAVGPSYMNDEFCDRFYWERTE